MFGSISLYILPKPGAHPTDRLVSLICYQPCDCKDPTHCAPASKRPGLVTCTTNCKTTTHSWKIKGVSLKQFSIWIFWKRGEFKAVWFYYYKIID